MESDHFDREGPEPATIAGLLLTVGGTAEPMVHAITRLRPKAVVFVCSEQTQATVIEIKKRIEPSLPRGDLPRFKSFLVDDPGNLIDCHRRVAEGLAWLRQEYGLDRENIRIDFTGGTKAMSAAAVLAAAPDGYRFVYVTGAQRDKEGVGVVKSGSEELTLPENPWTVLEEPDIRRLLEMAAVGQWAAALDSVSRLIDRSTPGSRPVFEELKRIVLGLAHWDRFEHAVAWKAWDMGKAPSHLVNLAKVGAYPLLADFAAKCGLMGKTLGGLANPPKDPKIPRKGHDNVVLDMLANGDRQVQRGTYDEAALRYYRALELCVARRLKILHQIDNSAVKKEQVPAPLREEFLKRQGEPGENGWELGQYASVQLLAAKGDTLGQRLLARMQENKIDSQARNKNWLIHGTQHVAEKQFVSFKQSILEALDIGPDAIPTWPNFRP